MIPVFSPLQCSLLAGTWLLFASIGVAADGKRHVVREHGFSISVPDSWKIDSKERSSVAFHAFSDAGLDVLVIAAQLPEYDGVNARAFVESELRERTFFERMVVRMLGDARLLERGKTEMDRSPAMYYVSAGKLPDGGDASVFVFCTIHKNTSYYVVGKVEVPDSDHARSKALVEIMKTFRFE